MVEVVDVRAGIGRENVELHHALCADLVDAAEKHHVVGRVNAEPRFDSAPLRPHVRIGPFIEAINGNQTAVVAQQLLKIRPAPDRLDFGVRMPEIAKLDRPLHLGNVVHGEQDIDPGRRRDVVARRPRGKERYAELRHEPLDGAAIMNVQSAAHARKFTAPTDDVPWCVALRLEPAPLV